MAKKEKEEKTVAVVSDTRLEKIERKVRLRGIVPLMTDRYAGDNDTKLEWHQKIYLIPGTNTLCIPTTNIMSFLSAQNTTSAPKRLREPKKYKKICDACLSYTMIEGYGDDPMCIPILRDGKEITVGSFGEDREPQSGLYLMRHVARLAKGIPNPKERPVLPLPWALEFKLTIFPNREIKETEIYNLFVEGGRALGMGTFRGVFGKFEVDLWE